MKRMMMGCLGRIRSVSLSNIVANGNFASTATWFSTGASFSVSGNEAAFTANSTTDNLYQAVSVTSAHKYYMCGWTKAASGANITMGLSDGGAVTQQASYSGAGSYQFWSILLTSGRTGTGTAWALIDNRSSAWNAVNSKYITIIDLTAAFGSGSEPTQTQMDSIMPQFSNSWLDGTQTAWYGW